MNRRDFLKQSSKTAAAAVTAPYLPATTQDFRTRHLIWIINGNGSRKQDWLDNPSLSPNYVRLSGQAFVYTDSHNDTVANHTRAWTELITGNPGGQAPTAFHYLRRSYEDAAMKYWFVNGVASYRRWQFDGTIFGSADPIIFTASDLPGSVRRNPRLQDFVDSISERRLDEDFDLRHPPIARQPFIGDAAGFASIPYIMKAFKPRLLILHQVGHDVAHAENGAAEYEQVCRTTDEQIGRLLDFIQGDPYFSKTTAILVRPEFGRDDEVTQQGELHHSEGYPQTMRSAEIWYGPDLKTGVCNRVTNRCDVVPSLTRLFNVDAARSAGKAHLEMFDARSLRFPRYNGMFD